MAIEPGWCNIEFPAAGVAVLEFHGEQDMSTMYEVNAAFESLAARNQNIVLDLSATEFVDSTIVHAIYSFAARQADAGRSLVLQVGGSAVIRRVLDLVGLLDRLPWVEDRMGAIALLQDPPTA